MATPPPSWSAMTVALENLMTENTGSEADFVPRWYSRLTDLFPKSEGYLVIPWVYPFVSESKIVRRAVSAFEIDCRFFGQSILIGMVVHLGRRHGLQDHQRYPRSSFPC